MSTIALFGALFSSDASRRSIGIAVPLSISQSIVGEGSATKNGTSLSRRPSPQTPSPLPLRGWDHAGQADEFFGVLGFVVDPDLIVHVGAGAAAGAAEKADLLMLGDPLPDRDDVAVKMGVKGGDAVSVIDLDHLAVVAVIPGVGHGPRRGGVNRRHVGRRQIDPGMKGRAAIERIAARAEPALELIIIERHR